MLNADEPTLDQVIGVPRNTVGKLAELLERNGISLDDVAAVNRVNAWQGMIKNAEGEPELIDMVGIQLIPEWATGPRWPVVAPAKPTIVRPTKTKPRSGGLQRAVILPDIQIGFRQMRDGSLDPFHDESAIGVALAVIKALQPDRVIFLGDGLDFPAQSKYIQEPSWALTTQAAIDRKHLLHAQVRAAAPAATQDELEGNHDCLDSSTRVVTQKGFVNVDELLDGDTVLSVDDDGNSEWVPITAVIRKQHTGDMIHLRSRYVDALMTPQHRVVGRSVNNGRWVEWAASACGPPFLAISAGHGAHLDYEVSDTLLRLAAWSHTDSHVSSSRAWTFYQSENKRSRIEQLLEGFDVRVTARDRDITEICGKKLSKPPQVNYEYHIRDEELTESLTELVPDKDHLSPWVWKLSERQVDLFVQEWVYTDGTIPPTGRTCRVIYCSREALRHEMMALMAANGWRVFETEYAPSYWRINCTKRVTSKVEARSTRNANTFVKAVHHEGEVWCLNVPHGRFFVERNGRIFLTGNCRLTKSIMVNAAASFGLQRANQPESWPVLTVPHLCRYDELGVTYHSGYPANVLWVNDNLRCIHGLKVRSAGSTASLVADDERVSTIFGHIHRIELQHRTRHVRAGPRFSFAASPGCLCRIDGAVPSVKGGIDLLGRPLVSYENWQQGLCVVSYEEGDGPFALEMVPIHNGIAIFRGDVFEGAT